MIEKNRGLSGLLMGHEGGGRSGLDWIEQSLMPHPTHIGHFGGGLHSQSLDCYWQTNNKEKLNINHKKTHKNTIRIKVNKQLNIQQKQNYPDSVASYDTQPGNEVGLFYNGPSTTRAMRSEVWAGGVNSPLGLTYM